MVSKDSRREGAARREGEDGSQPAVAVRIEGGSPEAVALALLQGLLMGERAKRVDREPWVPPQDWLLATYTELVAAVKAVEPMQAPPRSRASSRKPPGASRSARAPAARKGKPAGR